MVLLVLDTVRADHLSSYGYELPTTPSIDALAEGADRYTNDLWNLFSGALDRSQAADAGVQPARLSTR